MPAVAMGDSSGDSHSMGDSDPKALFTHVARQMRDRGLAFICLREYLGPDSLLDDIKQAFGGVVIANEQLTRESAEDLLRTGRADAAAFADEDGLGGVGFSTAERARVRELLTPERPAARARLWTRKEALVKAAGTGFTGDPAAVDALTVPADVVLVDLTDRLPGGLVGALARRGR